MLRTTALPAVLLLGLTLAGSPVAGAAGETCQGVPATLVGEAGRALDGTEGADLVRLHARLTDWDNPVCGTRRSVVDGGSGDDDLTGGKGRDRLIGGPGRDAADGMGGRDTCAAERTTGCEVRR